MAVPGVFPFTDILRLSVQDRTIETAGGNGDRHAQVDYWTDGVQTLAWLGEMKTYLVAAAIALVSIPFVTSQLDG
jgi:hypothetical protein